MDAAYQQILKNDINNTPAFDSLKNTTAGKQQITDAYNALIVPAFYVWKTSVNRADILQDPSFDWTRVDNLSVGKARIWDAIFVNGAIDPSKPNVRAGIDATWSTAGDATLKAAVYVLCKSQATRIQKLLSSGTGSQAVPATMFAGITETFQLSYFDVEAALSS